MEPVGESVQRVGIGRRDLCGLETAKQDTRAFKTASAGGVGRHGGWRCSKEYRARHATCGLNLAKACLFVFELRRLRALAINVTLDHGILELSLAEHRLRLPFTVVRIGEAWGRPLVQVQFEAAVRDLPGLQSLLAGLHDVSTGHDRDLAGRPNDAPHALLPVVRERAS